MNIKDINYIDYGKNIKGTIVLLHGWGQNIQMMDMLGRPFQENYRIIVIDFPGFGKSPEPDKAWSAEDYTSCLFEFLKSKKVKDPILVGHSFGGRVAICYAGKYGAKKVILLSSPFRPGKRSKTFAATVYNKGLKNIKIFNPIAKFFKRLYSSKDYLNASKINQETIKLVVNEDLTKFASNIKCPVILIYGEKDKDVPLEEGKALNKLIKNSALIVYKKCTHYAYLQGLNNTLAIMDSFLKEKE